MSLHKIKLDILIYICLTYALAVIMVPTTTKIVSLELNKGDNLTQIARCECHLTKHVKF